MMLAMHPETPHPKAAFLTMLAMNHGCFLRLTILTLVIRGHGNRASAPSIRGSILRPLRSGDRKVLQGYLAHKKVPPPLGLSQGPAHL